MSKRTTTQWYVGAWVVWMLAFFGLVLAMRRSTYSSVPAGAMAVYGVMALAAVVMLVMWAAALVKLGRLRSWGWFAAVLVPHPIGLGIVGMVAYGISGPEDSGEVVYRPTAT